MRSVLCIVLASMTVAALAACSESPGDDGGGSGDGDGDGIDVPPGCGNKTPDPGEQCDDGNDNRFDGCRPDCTIVDPIEPEPMKWDYFEIPGTKCIDGSPAGFSVNYNPASTNLFIYLEGGGACFNAFCDSLFTRGANQPGGGGIFDRDKAENPVRDWTWVYVPYCSGDVYGGEAETMLAGKMRYFFGYSNITAFLERWVPSFSPEQVVLSGSSAGGFGAAVNYAQTQRAFGAAPVTLLDDSGPPMSADVFPPCLQSLWRTTWGMDKTLIKECGDDCASTGEWIADSFDHVLREFPDMKGGMFSSTADSTIRTFAGYGWGGGYDMCKDTPSAVAGTVYAAGLEDLRTRVKADAPGVGTFYVPGSSHTVLRGGNFYNLKMGESTVAQWLTNAIGGKVGHVGP